MTMCPKKLLSQFLLFVLFFSLALAGCGGVEHDHGLEGHSHGDGDETHGHGDHDDGDHGHDHDGGLVLTAWGERFEIFAEVAPPVAGEEARSHTHVTLLDGYRPMTDGTVTAVLRRNREEQIFTASEPSSPGIFDLTLVADTVGRYDLAFRVETVEGREEISAGRISVGTRGRPGEIVEAPPGTLANMPGEPVSFTKEQQWNTAFATHPVERGSLRQAVRGATRVRPMAGGEVLLTAPVDGRVEASPWPHPGAGVAAGAPVLRLVITAAREESLASLAAGLREAEAALAPARARWTRLRELAELEAVSRGEVEEAQARVESLEARRDAARRDLETARAARGSSNGAAGGGERLAVRAPWRGEVAAVLVTPGEVVAAGAPLVRLLRPRPLWLEIALEPRAAARLEEHDGEPEGVILWPDSDEPVEIAGDGLRWVAASPEAAGASGTVPVLVEVTDPPSALRPGLRLETSVLLPESREGVVIPAAALVDDGGVVVVYLQLDGESFLRREVAVEARQGERVLVTGVPVGARLVTRGGGAIRRASLMASGSGHGHVH